MKYLGIDYGLKRVGLAISEGELASSLKVITVSGLADAVSKIKKAALENRIDKIVVGMPEGETAKLVEKFINALKRAGLEVEEADETLSSQNASKLMIEMGLSKKKRSRSDAQAAAEILQQFLDSR